jgi:threonine dehydratase
MYACVCVCVYIHSYDICKCVCVCVCVCECACVHIYRLGAEVVLVGENFDEAKAYALARSAAEDMVFTCS